MPRGVQMVLNIFSLGPVSIRTLGYCLAWKNLYTNVRTPYVNLFLYAVKERIVVVFTILQE